MSSAWAITASTSSGWSSWNAAPSEYRLDSMRDSRKAPSSATGAGYPRPGSDVRRNQIAGGADRLAELAVRLRGGVLHGLQRRVHLRADLVDRAGVIGR